MTITPNVLTFGVGAASGATLTTASVTPGANRLVLAVCSMRFDADPGANVFSLAGNGLTWVRVAEVATTATGSRSTGLFRAMGASPSAGTIVITSSSGAVEVAGSWVIVEFSGVDTTGTNGSGAVGTPATGLQNSGTSLGITITGTPATDDVTFAGFGTEDGRTPVKDALWDTLQDTGDGTDTRNFADWSTGQDLSPTWTFSASSAEAIGFIIKAAAASGTAKAFYTNFKKTKLRQPITAGRVQ